MHDPMFPSEQYKRERRIQGFNENGTPIGGLQPKKKLAEQMVELATGLNNEKFIILKNKIIQRIRSEAEQGSRTVYVPLDSGESRFKEQIMKWLAEEGFNASYSYDQRDGASFTVTF